jgi:hypothetical protein
MALLGLLAQSPLATGGILLLAVLLFYIIYQRHFHPLAKYPGPFLASLTDLWQVHQFLSLQQPYNLTKLHERYGSIVRYGPDKLSITHESAIPIIYQKSGRSIPKTEFYDAYGAAHPNVFGMRDESVHFYPWRPHFRTIAKRIPPAVATCPTASLQATSKKWRNIWISILQS